MERNYTTMYLPKLTPQQRYKLARLTPQEKLDTLLRASDEKDRHMTHEERETPHAESG